MTTPGNLPAFQVLVAFNNSQLSDPGLITTVAANGTLGAANVWTDLTRRVLSMSWGRGRQHVLDRFETGTATVELSNEDGVLTQFNASSPYAGLMSALKPFRIQATVGGTTYPCFTGLIDVWTLNWPSESYSTVTISALDAFSLLNLAPLVGGAAYDAAVLAAGATTYLKLNEPAGARFVADSAPNGHFGIVVQGQFGSVPGFGPNVILGSAAGPVLTSTDTAADFGTLTATGGCGWVWVTGGAFSANQSWSVEAWVKTTSAGWAASQNGPSGTANSWVLSVGQNAAATIVTAAGAVYTITNATPTADGLWHHIALSYNSATDLATIYVDGAQTVSAAVVVTGGLALGASDQLSVGSSAGTAGAVGGLQMGRTAFYAGTAISNAQAAAHYALGVGFVTELSGAQVNDAADIVGWPAGARNIDAGSSMCQANSSDLTTTAALSYLAVVDATEDGAMFMDRSGDLRFISRTALLAAPYTTSQATFGDGGGAEIPFQASPQVVRDSLDQWDRVDITRRGGMMQSAGNPAGPRVHAESGLLHTSDSDALNHAQWTQWHSAAGVDRIRQITVRPIVGAGVPAIVLARELMDRVTVKRHSPPGGGSTFTQVALIEHIAHNVDAATGEWKVDLALSSSDALGSWWVLGTSALGSTAVLA